MDKKNLTWTLLACVLMSGAFLTGWLISEDKVANEPAVAGGDEPAPATGPGGAPMTAAQPPATRGTPVPPPVALKMPPVSPAGIQGVKDAYAGKFPVGTAADVGGGFKDTELQAIRENFSMLMAENCMKPQPIHPTEATWNWTAADQLVEFAQNNNMQVIGHTLVWHSQTALWFFQNTDGDGGKDLLTGRMKTHIQTLVGRYKGKVAVWNVVNEALNDSGAAGVENLRSTSPWMRVLGPGFLTLAFKFAHEADPDARLFYNDYNIERGPKHQSSILLLKRLLAEGAPIYGVGIEGHWASANMPFAELEKALEAYGALGLKVAISELDITLGNNAAGAKNPLEVQAAAYRRLMEILLAHRNVISHVVFYNINDRRSWRSGQSPTLFDTAGQPKPAWQAVIDAGIAKPGP